MKNKPTIVVCTGYYLPGYKSGGPVKSIENIVENLHSDFHFRILAADRDLGDSAPYAELKKDTWHQVGKAEVKYLAPDQRSLTSIWREVTNSQPDLLYLNSFFGSWFSIFPLLGVRIGKIKRMPILIAPRGEFSIGATSIKAGKKKVYIKAARSLGLLKEVLWHSSSEFEKMDIRRVTSTHPSSIFVASDLMSPVPNALHEGKRDDDKCLHVLFLSRITTMKNLDFALDVLRDVKENVVFNIYGPLEDEVYWSLCKKKIVALPDNVCAKYYGGVSPSSVRDIMRNNDLFFLPTRGENFGHVITEALSVGTRVLISDQTPWRELFQSGLGDDFPLSDRTKFIERIESLARSAPEERLQDRIKRHSIFKTLSLNSPEMVRNRDMFNAALKYAEK